MGGDFHQSFKAFSCFLWRLITFLWCWLFRCLLGCFCFCLEWHLLPRVTGWWVGKPVLSRWIPEIWQVTLKTKQGNRTEQGTWLRDQPTEYFPFFPSAHFSFTACQLLQASQSASFFFTNQAACYCKLGEATFQEHRWVKPACACACAACACAYCLCAVCVRITGSQFLPQLLAPPDKQVTYLLLGVSPIKTLQTVFNLCCFFIFAYFLFIRKIDSILLSIVLYNLQIKFLEFACQLYLMMFLELRSWYHGVWCMVPWCIWDGLFWCFLCFLYLGNCIYVKVIHCSVGINLIPAHPIGALFKIQLLAP